MTSLYNRANHQQRRILRIVEGAVKNAADAHAEINFTPQMARSIAKRAAGTLTAQWPEVLAAKMPSDKVGVLSPKAWPPAMGSDLPKGPSRGSQYGKGQPRGVRRASNPHTPLRFLWNRFSLEVGYAKHMGNTERAKAFIEVLRAIDAQLNPIK